MYINHRNAGKSVSSSEEVCKVLDRISTPAQSIADFNYPIVQSTKEQIIVSQEIDQKTIPINVLTTKIAVWAKETSESLDSMVE